MELFPGQRILNRLKVKPPIFFWMNISQVPFITKTTFKLDYCNETYFER